MAASASLLESMSGAVSSFMNSMGDSAVTGSQSPSRPLSPEGSKGSLSRPTTGAVSRGHTGTSPSAQSLPLHGDSSAADSHSHGPTPVTTGRSRPSKTHVSSRKSSKVRVVVVVVIVVIVVVVVVCLFVCCCCRCRCCCCCCCFTCGVTVCQWRQASGHRGRRDSDGGSSCAHEEPIVSKWKASTRTCCSAASYLRWRVICSLPVLATTLAGVDTDLGL